MSLKVQLSRAIMDTMAVVDRVATGLPSRLVPTVLARNVAPVTFSSSVGGGSGVTGH
jgi:hypothetical protein